ncbi:MAG: GntR family transcriptional regulator [Anaerolineales bacterium]|nr:MAG: GntR family transcriptional regulator [Anaerolineales bacterium]
MSRDNGRVGRRAVPTSNSNKKPLYLRISEELAQVIDALEPGSYLPSEPTLAKQLGVSRATLREAMRLFEGRGLIIRRQGVGTMVTASPQVITSGIETLESIESQAGRFGLKVKMGDFKLDRRRPTTEERDRFDLEQDTLVVHVSRTIEAEARPVAYLIDILPESLLPAETRLPGFSGSILDLMLQREHPAISHAKTELMAIAAPREIARELHVQRGEVLLRLESWLFAKEGEIVDHTYSYFLPGTFRFHVLRRPAEI